MEAILSFCLGLNVLINSLPLMTTYNIMEPIGSGNGMLPVLTKPFDDVVMNHSCA